jgi:hypothetical protein
MSDDAARVRWEAARAVVDGWTNGRKPLGHLVDDIADAILAAEVRGRLAEREAIIALCIDRQWLVALDGIRALAGTTKAWQPTHRHYKGDLYRVIGPVQLSEDQEVPHTLYENENGKRLARPTAMFNDTLPDGSKRFAALGTTPIDKPGEPT